MTNSPNCQYNFHEQSNSIEKNKKKTAIVLWITIVTMIVEVVAGTITGSMALTADGWHMATHAAALFITFVTYKLAASQKLSRKLNFGGGKLIPLGGYTSALFLLVMVVWIAYESIERFFNPIDIQYTEALIVAVIGLIVNVICAGILGFDHHHDHSHGHAHSHNHDHDHNIRGAYIHVLSDALTSVGAIIALLMAPYFNLPWLDPFMGIIGSIVILIWAIGLIRVTAWELLDGHATQVNYELIRDRISQEGAIVKDLHVWKIAPNAHAAELILKAPTHDNINHIKEILSKEFHLQHIVIEIQTGA